MSASKKVIYRIKTQTGTIETDFRVRPNKNGKPFYSLICNGESLTLYKNIHANQELLKVLKPLWKKIEVKVAAKTEVETNDYLPD